MHPARCPRSAVPFAPLLLPLLALLLAPAARGAGDDPFVFVSLPDTQVYAEDRVPDGRSPAVTDARGTGAIFYDQTEWIVDNADALGIRYVGRLGDIVQNGEDTDEWVLAHDAMHALLEADIPHGTVMGNHDDIENAHGVDYRKNYLDFFGPRNFADRPWYTASSPEGGANLVVLEHRYRRIGFLNFSIDHPQAEIDWATQIVESNPDVIFIVGTHRYLYDFKIAGGRYGEPVEVSTPEISLGEITYEDSPVPGAVEPNSAQEFFDEFVSQHPNILMIHAGHFHAEWTRLDDTNAAGEQLIQILTDYQSTRNGGDGYLRLYELDFDEGTFGYDTYSPTLDRKRTTLDHFVETIYLVWDQRGQIKDFTGIPNDAIYFALIDGLLKKDGDDANDGFLLQHPDFDEPEERAYYEQYLRDLFMDDFPEGLLDDSDGSLVDDILTFEKLWLRGFAADPEDPTDFRGSIRSPSYTLDVDFSRYFTPSTDQRVAFSFEDLLEALAGLDRGDFWFPAIRSVLAQRVERAFHLFEAGRPDRAQHLLEASVLNRTDGCAAQGRPDPLRPFWIFFWLFQLFTFDWIDSCDAQDQVQPLLVETIDALGAAADGA